MRGLLRRSGIALLLAAAVVGCSPKKIPQEQLPQLLQERAGYMLRLMQDEKRSGSTYDPVLGEWKVEGLQINGIEYTSRASQGNGPSVSVTRSNPPGEPKLKNTLAYVNGECRQTAENFHGLQNVLEHPATCLSVFDIVAERIGGKEIKGDYFPDFIAPYKPD